jgi:hypothetical protein
MTALPHAALLLLALGSLSGCVMFAQPPAPLTCDADLVGRWIPLPDSPQDKVPLGADDYADVDAQCHVRLRDSAKTAQPEFDALGFSVGDQRYLALGFKELDGLFAASAQTPGTSPKSMPATAVTLIKYRIRGDQLEIAMLDVVQVMQRIEQGTLKARETDTSTYLFEGGPKKLQALLASNPDLFDAFDGRDRTLRMRRAAAGELR